LGHEQVAKGDDDHDDRQIGKKDADTWKIVTYLAVFAELAVLHYLTSRRLDYRPPGGERVGTLGGGDTSR
jgi:hypothetical protein